MMSSIHFLTWPGGSGLPGTPTLTPGPPMLGIQDPWIPRIGVGDAGTQCEHRAGECTGDDCRAPTVTNFLI